MRQFPNQDTNLDDFALNFSMIHNDAKNFEGLHNHGFSKSPSHSSYYGQNSDFDGSDKLNDEEVGSNGRTSNVRRKPIQKHYEPIVYNGLVYKYDDDPSEYKKARKRVQNRVSATRVRNKKKTYVEELEAEIQGLREENSELKTKNNVLTTENTLLKQQIGFFEKLVMNTPKPASSDWNQDACAYPPADVRLEMESGKEESPIYYRAVPSGRIKKHTAFLGMLTILLCMFGTLSESEETYFSSLTTNLFGGNSRMSAYSTKEFINQSDPLKTFLDDPTNILSLSIKLIFMMGYVIYTLYVITMVHRHFASRVK